jgi:5-hydroxyisourate hydrolase-like protein (transthyretin family)
VHEKGHVHSDQPHHYHFSVAQCFWFSLYHAKSTANLLDCVCLFGISDWNHHYHIHFFPSTHGIADAADADEISREQVA